MKKESKELARTLGFALVAMMAVPIAYRVWVHFWPPDEKPRQSLAQFFEEAKIERGKNMLTKPIAKWSDGAAKSEPEIYEWLKDQGDEILPWEWTEEARRKDPRGYAKCWRRIWKERLTHCGKVLSESRKEIKRLDRELQILTTIHTHRTNQIARLRVLSVTNSFPCRVALERLEKGRFWGWNTPVEVVECADVASILAETNSVCSKELAAAQGETRDAIALSSAIAFSKEKAALQEKLCEICGKCSRLIEENPVPDELLQKSLVEVLKGAKP